MKPPRDVAARGLSNLFCARFLSADDYDRERDYFVLMKIPPPRWWLDL